MAVYRQFLVGIASVSCRCNLGAGIVNRFCLVGLQKVNALLRVSHPDLCALKSSVFELKFGESARICIGKKEN